MEVDYSKLFKKYKFNNPFSQKFHSSSKKITAQKQKQLPVMRDLHLSSHPFSKIINNILPKRMFRKNDWDGDGVPNRLDCQPRNVMRQDFGQQPIAHLSPQQQIKLFKQGLKPTMMTPINIDNYSFFVGSPSWIKTDDKTGQIIEQGPSNKIYYRDDTKQEAINLLNLDKKRDMSSEYHINMAKNLGYSRNETFNFIKKSKHYVNSTEQEKINYYNMIYEQKQTNKPISNVGDEIDSYAYRSGIIKQKLEKFGVGMNEDVYASINMVDKISLEMSRKYNINLNDMRDLVNETSDYNINDENDVRYVLETILIPKFLKE